MKLLDWVRRRRRFESRRWESDEDACHGADGMEAAGNWMQYVLGRDFDGQAVQRCVIVAEVGEGHQAQVVYTTHDVHATPVEVRGLLEEGLRGLDEIRIRAFRRHDIEEFVNAAVPQIVARLRESETPPTPEEMARVVSGLVHKQQDPEGGMEVEDES
jgi:hypothetical protein